MEFEYNQSMIFQGSWLILITVWLLQS